ncbi:MAG: ACT domain-containing protein [Thermoproteota archaeon]|nr:ACT domain-containing protein [Candidatus Brockarchaeota archaeon]
MPKTYLLKIDDRGRILIPQAVRDLMGLRPQSETVGTYDSERNVFTLMPARQGGNFVRIVFKISDQPGSLAKVANMLASSGINLVATSSTTLVPGKLAEWEVIADIDKNYPLKERLKAIADSLRDIVFEFKAEEARVET